MRTKMLDSTVVIADCDLSVPALAEKANVSPDLIAGCIDLARYGDSDPLPTILFNKQHKVRWSAWCDWSMRRLGPGGDLRGVFSNYLTDLKESA